VCVQERKNHFYILNRQNNITNMQKFQFLLLYILA